MEEEEEEEVFDASDDDYKDPNRKVAEAEQRLMNAREKAMNRPRYDIPLLIPPLFHLTPHLKDQLWERYTTLTNDRNSVRAQRFLFMLHNFGQDYSQTLWNDKMKPDLIDLESTEQQSGANLTPPQIIDITEQNTEDSLVRTSGQPHSNIVEPSRAVDANANRESGKDQIENPIDFISGIENYHGTKETIENAIQAYSAIPVVLPIPKPLSQEDKVDLYWKTLYLLPNDITNAKEDSPEAWWRDTVFVPLIFQFRQVLDATRFKWIAENTIAITTNLESKSGRTDGGIVLRNNNELLAILFEYKKDNSSNSRTSTALATDQASRYCHAGLASRHALYPHANHKVMAIIGEGSKITAACASMTDTELAMENLTNPKEWNLRNFDEIFNFAVFLSSLSSFLEEEDAKCQPKRRRSASGDDDEQTRALKKAKIDSVPPCPFVVPFSQRKAIDGTFALYSRSFQGDNNHRLISILEHTELNVHLLQNNGNILVSKNLSPIVALVTLQGRIGVPKLLAYRCGGQQNSSHVYLIETTNLTEMPEPMLPLKDMIAQYAKALIEQHKHCLSLGRDTGIRWKGQEIKFIQWNYCGFRGDCCASVRDMPADSMLDMLHFGNAIQRWSERLNSTEFLPLANNLMNACPYQRASPEYVLRVLENQSLLDQAVKLPRKSFKNALNWCSEAELNDFVKRKMYAAAKQKNTMSLQSIQWHNEVIKKNVRRGTVMDGTNQINIVGKTLNIAFSIHWGAGLEFTISKLMSGKQYFPKLLDYEFTHDDNIPLANKIDTLLLIFSEYNKEPKQRDIFRTARHLLTAVKMLHEKRIIHCDIAPSNVMWDDTDDLVLIDFGSTFWFNYLPPYEEGTSQCMLRDYGHEGFAPREKVRFPVTDVFGAGRLIEHWANEWNQMTPELKNLIQAMTYDEWYRRIDLDDALARLNQVEQNQYQKACEIEVNELSKA